MNRKLLIALLIVLMAGLLSLWLLKAHTVEIIHAVVVNSVIQKAPEGYDRDTIKEVFDNALIRAEKGGYSDRYLEKLKEVFRSLEKRQYLEREEMDELLAGLRDYN